MDAEVAAVLVRNLRRHSWWPKFQQAFPGWTIGFQRMDGDEFIDWARKKIKVALWLPDPMFRVAHAIGHIAKHGCAEGRTFTDEEEDEADEFAQFWRIVLADIRVALPKQVENA